MKTSFDLKPYEDGLAALDNIGVLLKGARMIAGVSATEAAAAIGVSSSHITTLESGELSGMRLDTALRVARWAIRTLGTATEPAEAEANA